MTAPPRPNTSAERLSNTSAALRDCWISPFTTLRETAITGGDHERLRGVADLPCEMHDMVNLSIGRIMDVQQTARKGNPTYVHPELGAHLRIIEAQKKPNKQVGRRSLHSAFDQPLVIGRAALHSCCLLYRQRHLS